MAVFAYSVRMVCSESVDLQLELLGNSTLGQELEDIVSLIALKLDDLAIFGVIDDRAVAAKLLLAGLDNLFLVELGIDALDGRQGLATIALLNAYVNECVGDLVQRSSGLGLRKRINGVKILDRHAVRRVRRSTTSQKR